MTLDTRLSVFAKDALHKTRSKADIYPSNREEILQVPQKFLLWQGIIKNVLASFFCAQNFPEIQCKVRPIKQF